MASKFSPMVCANCHRRKRKCDKKKAGCTLCAQSHIQCRYGWSRAVLAAQNLHFDATSVFGDPGDVLPAKPTSVVTSFSSTAWEDVHEMPILQNRLNGDPDIEKTLQNQVDSIINANGGTVADSCALYFQTVHRWMPVMSRKRIHDDIVYRQERRTADLSSLLLSIYLIIQMPSISENFTTYQQNLYSSTKSLYEQASVLCPPSLSLIQSGLLISTFEHCHGYVEAACLSIGKCARMAIEMKLNVKVSALPKKCNDTWELIQEETNLWWGIVIRERFIHLESVTIGTSLVTTHTTINDLLPEECDIWEAAFNTSSVIVNRPPLPLGAITLVGDFARQAQAADLVGQVLCHINGAEDYDTRYAKYIMLDTKLQDYLRHCLAETRGVFGKYCGAIGMIVSSLFVLHRDQLNYNIRNRTLLSDRTFSVIALQSITRMSLEISNTFNTNIHRYRPAYLSPNNIQIYLRAAQEHMNFGTDEGSAEWLEYVNGARQSLRYFSSRWRISDCHLNDIETKTKVVLRNFERVPHAWAAQQ